ncbi:MAG: HNH endonuclease [Acidobacteria bacterium]|nr:HNH endonuclease [Acidobacteriota bacterium]
MTLTSLSEHSENSAGVIACMNCGNQTQQVRAWTKFCSAKCRSHYHDHVTNPRRNRLRTPSIQTTGGVQIVNSCPIFWDRAITVQRGGRKRRVVPISCSNCGSERIVDAGSLLYQIARRNFTGRCKECAPLLKRQRCLEDYRSRGRQELPDGTVIDWRTIEAPPRGFSGTAFLVDVICSCGHRRKRQVGAIYRKGIVRKTICRKCADQKHGQRIARQNNPNFKKGYWITPQGYKVVVIGANHPMIQMAANFKKNGSGRILEHRLVMAMSLGRCLEPWEQVHHLNKEKTDNRVENLQIVTPKEHTAVTAMEREIKRLRQLLHLERKKFS